MKDRQDRNEALARLGARLARQHGAGGTACPGADIVAGYLDRTLDVRERAQCEEHFAACARCQEVLAGLARSETLSPQVQPERRQAWAWSLLRWQWLAPAVAVLAVGVMWAIVRPTLWRATPPLAQLSVPPAELPAAPTAGAAVAEADARLDASREARFERQEVPRRSTPEQLAEAPAEGKATPPAPPASKGKSERLAEPAVAIAQSVPVEMPKDVRVDAVQAQKAAEAPRPAAAPVAEERAAAPQLGMSRTGAARVMATAEAVSPATVVASPASAISWRIGAAGSIERSADGQRTWQKQASGVTANLLAGAAPSETVCWVVGQRGTVLRTIDGRTWEAVSPPAAVDLVRVTARDAAAATVVAADGRRFSTIDGGRTWQTP